MPNNPTNIPPTKEFIRNTLQYGLISDGDLDNRSWTGRFNGSLNSEAAYLVGRNRGRAARLFIKFSYDNKERIKSIPILRNVALYTKEKLMNQRSIIANRSALDFSPILGLGVEQFIPNLYMTALGRLPDEEGFNSAKRALLSGLPKEALIYLVCTSAEFANRAPVAHLNEYHRMYSRYTLRERIKRMPIIGLPFQIRAMERQLAALTAAMEMANQNITFANLKIDNAIAKVQQNAGVLATPIIYGVPGGVTVVQLEKFIFGVPSEEWRLAKYLSQGGTFEPGTEKYFCSIIREDMVVLDIGAYLGIYTLHALTAGCIVYSYEPTPQIFKILSDNIGINGFEPTGRAHPYNLVVSNTEGEVDFNLFNSGQNNSIFDRDEENRKTRVKSVCLDTHLSQVDHIDVVKIDVEGAEPLVLQGMKGIIASNPAIKIIMEFAPANLERGGTDPCDFLHTIRSMGLDIHAIEESSGRVLNVSDEDLCRGFSVNLLLENKPN